MSSDNFFNLKELAADLRYNNVSKNTNGETVKIADIKILKVTKEQPATMFYKYSYAQEHSDTVCLTNKGRKIIMIILKVYS
jgi:hypothetical protein